MRRISGDLLKIIGFACSAYGIFVIVKWYVLWLSHYFIGNIKPSIVVGIATCFLSPLAGITDLLWHSFPKPTIEMWVYFMGFFICGGIVIFIGDKVGGGN